MHELRDEPSPRSTSRWRCCRPATWCWSKATRPRRSRRSRCTGRRTASRCCIRRPEHRGGGERRCGRHRAAALDLNGHDTIAAIHLRRMDRISDETRPDVLRRRARRAAGAAPRRWPASKRVRDARGRRPRARARSSARRSTCRRWTTRRWTATRCAARISRAGRAGCGATGCAVAQRIAAGSSPATRAPLEPGHRRAHLHRRDDPRGRGRGRDAGAGAGRRRARRRPAPARAGRVDPPRRRGHRRGRRDPAAGSPAHAAGHGPGGVGRARRPAGAPSRAGRVLLHRRRTGDARRAAAARRDLQQQPIHPRTRCCAGSAARSPTWASCPTRLRPPALRCARRRTGHDLDASPPAASRSAKPIT